MECELDAASAEVHGVTGQMDHVEGVHHRGRGGELLDDGCFETGEAVYRDGSNTLAPASGLGGQPGLEGVFRASFDYCDQPALTSAGGHRGEVDGHGDVLVALVGVRPDVLVDTDDTDARQGAGL